jgi:hypothetical protein
MKIRLFAVATLLCLMANLVLAAQGPRTASKGLVIRKARGARLVPMLPASDGIVTIDAKRLTSDGLPRVLAANSTLLARVNAGIDEVMSKTGIDLRKFDEVAIGLKISPKAPKGVDIDGVALASGDINAAAMIAVAKLASNGTYREEKVAGRTVYVFTVTEIANKTAANSANAGIFGKAVHGMTTSIAVAAYDANMLVIGSPDRVRETLAGTSHSGADLTGLLNRNPAAILNFALKPTAGLEGLLPLDNDELGKNLRSIQYLSGAMDVTAAGASLNVAARTVHADEAQGLKSMLDGLQMMGTAMLGASNKPASQVYARMVKNAKFGQSGNEVTLDLVVPQSDIDTLISGLK